MKREREDAKLSVGFGVLVAVMLFFALLPCVAPAGSYEETPADDTRGDWEEMLSSERGGSERHIQSNGAREEPSTSMGTPIKRSSSNTSVGIYAVEEVSPLSVGVVSEDPIEVHALSAAQTLRTSNDDAPLEQWSDEVVSRSGGQGGSEVPGQTNIMSNEAAASSSE